MRREINQTGSYICLKMAVYEVFSHPELRRYKTHVCSKASLLLVIILGLTFIPPLFVVYRSYGKKLLDLRKSRINASLERINMSNHESEQV